MATWAVRPVEAGTRTRAQSSEAAFEEEVSTGSIVRPHLPSRYVAAEVKFSVVYSFNKHFWSTYCAPGSTVCPRAELCRQSVRKDHFVAVKSHPAVG